ncbi:MAG: DUF362 domain-containing protein [Candidatus Latescibacteria bacterium]|nr:DUF362 domain-containing protein [Candidatus Latescibacterota bacterium]
MKRRTFFQQAAITGSLIAGKQMTTLSHPHTSTAATQPSTGSALVGIAGSNDPALSKPQALDSLLDYEQVREIVWLALDRDTSKRNLPGIVSHDSWVVIKPNLVTCPVTMSDFHADGVEHWWLVTDLRVVRAVAEYLIERIGPHRISIAEGPIWYSSGRKLKKEEFLDGWHCKWEAFGNMSYVEIAETLSSKRQGTTIDIIDLNEDEAIYVTDFDPYKTGTGALQYVKPGDPDGTSETEWTKRRGIYLPRTVMDCDVLISVPVLKTHSSAGVTLCMKNLVGCIHSQTYGDGNSKQKIHQGSQMGLLRGVADLGCAINPDYAVVEGFWSTNQQHHGQNGVRLNHNVVIAGGDVVATEAVSMMVMGYNPLDYDLLRLLNKKKIGEWHPDKITISGPPVKKLSHNYVRAAETYFARGIRKWFILGPLKSPLDDVSNLNPHIGTTTEKNQWDLIDGDAVIDETINVSKPFKLQENLLYSLPGSDKARKGSLYYLALRINTPRKDLCGQLLVGAKGAEIRSFFNGADKIKPEDPLPYDPTPMPFLKFNEGENILVIEVKKTGGNKEDIKLAVNLCDLDGDRLIDITLDPQGE